MPTSFVVVPQWQGSASARAMRLIDGAEAIRGDLPAGATTVVEVPMEAGESLSTGVHRMSTLSLVRDATAAALADIDDPAIVIGGDCGVELAAVEHAFSRADHDVALVWFDAHPDLNTPESSRSGAFTGMVLRTLLGDGPHQLTPTPDATCPADRVVLAGTRAVDPAEADFIAAGGIRMLAVDELSTPDALLDAVAATKATSVYLHIDLDVLDPSVLNGLGDPQPFGLTTDALCDGIKAVRSRFSFAGAGLTGLSPASAEAAADDLATILRIIGALTSPTG